MEIIIKENGKRKFLYSKKDVYDFEKLSNEYLKASNELKKQSRASYSNTYMFLFCHSVEIGLKGFLLLKTGEFPKTHNINNLLKKITKNQYKEIEEYFKKFKVPTIKKQSFEDFLEEKKEISNHCYSFIRFCNSLKESTIYKENEDGGKKEHSIIESFETNYKYPIISYNQWGGNYSSAIFTEWEIFLNFLYETSNKELKGTNNG